MREASSSLSFACSSGRRSSDSAGAGSTSGACLPWNPLQQMRWSSSMWVRTSAR